MALPVVDVQVAFGDNPRVASPTFTSLTVGGKSPLLRAHVSRGRSHLAQRFSTGTAEFDLDNSDNRYDPAFTTGPHGANLKPLKPVQLLVGNGITPHTAFRGFAKRWAPKRESQARSVVTLSAVDIFELLATKRLRDSAYFDAVQALLPSWFWRLDDQVAPSPTFVTGAFQAVTGPDMIQIYSPQTTAGPLVTDPDPGISLDAEKGWIQGGTASSEIGVHNAYSVAFWFKTSSQGVNVSLPTDPSTNPGGTAPIIWTFQDWAGNSVTAWALWLGNLGPPDNTTVLYHAVNDPAAGASPNCYTGPKTVVNDGAWHHVAVTRDSAGTHMKIYVDGALAGSATVTAAVASGTQQDFYIGHDSAGGTGGNKIAFEAKDMAWWFNAELSGAQVLALYNAGIFPAETVGARLARCLDIVGVPTGWRSLDTGPDLVAYKDPLHHTFALEHMQLCVDSDAGQLFTSAAGDITYLQRTHAVPSSAGTFSDVADVGAGEIPYQPGDGPQIDPDDVYNEIDITGPGIKPVLLSDVTSDGNYGTRTYTLSNCQLAHQSDANATGTALLNRFKQPSVRTPSVAFTSPSTSSNGFAQAVNRELMDRITLDEQGPVNDGSPSSQVLYIEHIDHEIVPLQLMKTTFALSPY